MHFQKKLGIGFILFGLVVILLAYLIATNNSAFVFSALVGLMAVFFGAFQVMLSKLAVQSKSSGRHLSGKPIKSKKARR